MKDNTKNILDDLGNLLGYGSAIGLTIANGYVFYLINRDGRVKVLREPSKIIFWIEVLGFSGIGAFLTYKLVKTLRDKYNLKE